MWNFISSLLLLAVAATCIALGMGAMRDIGKGRTQSLSRRSTRIFVRHENPTAFWITIANGILWGFLGLFLLSVLLPGLVGY